MKYELVRGCVCDSLTVDGKEEIDMTDEERQAVIDNIYKSLKPKDLNYLLQWYIVEFGEYTCDDEPCECCGDCVEEWVLETE